jgi:hypothetical protein
MTGALHGERNGFEMVRSALTLWPKIDRLATTRPSPKNLAPPPPRFVGRALYAGYAGRGTP